MEVHTSVIKQIVWNKKLIITVSKLRLLSHTVYLDWAFKKWKQNIEKNTLFHDRAFFFLFAYAYKAYTCIWRNCKRNEEVKQKYVCLSTGIYIHSSNNRGGWVYYVYAFTWCITCISQSNHLTTYGNSFSYLLRQFDWLTQVTFT